MIYFNIAHQKCPIILLAKSFAFFLIKIPFYHKNNFINTCFIWITKSKTLLLARVKFILTSISHFYLCMVNKVIWNVWLYIKLLYICYNTRKLAKVSNFLLTLMFVVKWCSLPWINITLVMMKIIYQTSPHKISRHKKFAYFWYRSKNNSFI